MTLHYLLPHIAAAGFDRIEAWQWHVSGATHDELDVICGLAQSLGITMPYMAVYPAFHLEDGPEAEQAQAALFDLIERAGVLGVGAFKIMLGSRKGSEITEQETERHDRRFGEWYAACREAGIDIVAELHGGTLLDPYEVGKQWIDDHPEFEIGICYQPYDFLDPAAAVALADEFRGKIRHVHLQGRAADSGAFCLLADSPLDYATLLPRLICDNGSPSMTLEFVKDCIQGDVPFDLGHVLRSAQDDADFVERVTE